ncbi:MAG: hypothetical protein ACKVKO_08525 [Acidimicrobiales bacterium]
MTKLSVALASLGLDDTGPCDPPILVKAALRYRCPPQTHQRSRFNLRRPALTNGTRLLLLGEDELALSDDRLGATLARPNATLNPRAEHLRNRGEELDTEIAQHLSEHHNIRVVTKTTGELIVKLALNPNIAYQPRFKN